MDAKKKGAAEIRLEVIDITAVVCHRGYFGATVNEIGHTLHITDENRCFSFRAKQVVLLACHKISSRIKREAFEKMDRCPNEMLLDSGRGMIQ